jgi:hypothetical protein
MTTTKRTLLLIDIKQLQSMIDDLLEVTRLQAGKLTIELQCTSVSDAVVYTVDTLQGAARGKRVTLSSHMERHLPLVCADPTRIRQILIILVDNAIKFTPANGAVEVQTRTFEKNPAFLLVEVSDTGCGVRPEMTERIFEHLYQISDPGQAGRKGLGIGLHISKELVTRQGGKIWVSSEPQKGSHFFFTIPIFSLASWIGPTVTLEKAPGYVVALFAVELGSRDGWLSQDVRKEMSNVARTLLQQCLRPDTDVLLPNMDLASARDHFFIVAYTQERGAEIISERIRKQFQHCRQIQFAGLTIAVSHSFMTPMSREINESTETFVERAAAKMQDRINAIRLDRSIQWT